MPVDRTKYRVPTKDLRRVCEPVMIETEEKQDLGLGQEAALASMDIGLQMASDEYARSHYNIAVVGLPSTGRTTRTRRYLEARAEQEPCQPADAISVHDFDSPRRFIVAFVPNGTGAKVEEMLFEIGKKMIIELPDEIDEFRRERLAKLSARQDKIFQRASKAILPLNCALLLDSDSGRVLVLPLSLQQANQPMPEAEYSALPPDIRKEIDEQRDRAIAIAMPIINDGMRKQAEAGEKIIKTSVDEAVKRCEALLQPVRELVGENEEFNRYLTGLAKHTGMLTAKPQQQQYPMMPGSDGEQQELMIIMHWCTVRVLKDNSGVTHKPVVYVDAPRFTRLFGCPHAEMVGRDAMRMDHTMVEGGAFLEANGGYIVFELRNLLRLGRDPAFTKMLEVIRTGKLTIETMTNFLDLETMHDYRSSEIPIDVRVVLICNPRLEALLRHYEPEFDNLFRVVSEFVTDMPIEAAPGIYAKFVEVCRRSDDLPHFTPKAIARLVEYGSRRAGNQHKASTELGVLKDVIRESVYWSRKCGARQVYSKHVRQAIKARFDSRALRVRRYQEYVDSGHLLLSHEGAKIGQINGLVVFKLSSDIMFGMPKRLTARCFAGKEKVLLVQRKTKQSGPSSDTAIEDITGYLSGKYGRKKALSLAVQLSFEQTYGGIDGDSATVAELVAIISAITELPIDQRGVVTGSMNQWGEVQPIGGVNEKVEGHYDLLRRNNLLQPGYFAVVPQLNVHQFMLDDEVVEAQRKGLYQIYGITHVDQALEIFLNRPIAEIDRLIEAKLAEMEEDEEEPAKTGKPKKKKGKKKPAKN